jgi:hypothetical protein
MCAASVYGAIETRTEASWRVDDDGDILVSVDVFNDGEETAYDMETAMFLGRQAYFRGAPADSPPGASRHLDFRVEGTSINPGAYTAVIRVEFEEQVGLRHRIYHLVPILYLPEGSVHAPAPVRAAKVDPVFNPKVVGRNRGTIEVTLKNTSSAALQVRLAAWYPDGFSIRPDAVESPLAPGAEKTVDLDTALAGANNTAEYDLVIDTETEDRHYSVMLRGLLSVVPKPIYFRIYLVIAATGALLLAIRTLLTLRRS